MESRFTYRFFSCAKTGAGKAESVGDLNDGTEFLLEEDVYAWRCSLWARSRELNLPFTTEVVAAKLWRATRWAKHDTSVAVINKR